jgi:colicin import membrane protein
VTKLIGTTVTVLAALLVAVAASAAGASELMPAVPPPVSDPPPLPGIDLEPPIDRASAQEVLRRVAERRAAYEIEWAQRRAECYRRFLVNPCLAELRQEQRATQRRLEAVEVAARQALREDAAYQRNLREAQRLEQERASRAAEPVR